MVTLAMSGSSLLWRCPRYLLLTNQITSFVTNQDTARGGHVVARNVGRMLVISGGDGYEDFSANGSSELAGREDSTNHLLLWVV